MVNGQQVSSMQMGFRVIVGIILIGLFTYPVPSHAVRQQISIPRDASAATVIKMADLGECAERLLQTRNKHLQLLADRDKAPENEKEPFDKRIFDLWADFADVYQIEYDWLIQDLNGPIEQWVLSDDLDRVETDLIHTVAGQIGEMGEKMLHTLAALQQRPLDNGNSDRLRLYLAACQQRRHDRLKIMVENYPVIAFVKHYDLGGSHYAYTEGQSDAQQEAHFEGGAALCLLEINDSSTICRTLLEDFKGVIRDPDVSYNGQKFLFSWKKSRFEDDFHLYEYNRQQQQFSQITHGEGVSDYEGIYLPNGDMVFNSTRCVQTVDCWWTEVSNLYTCSSDGEYLRRLSFDQVHTNYPQVLEDGRVIYTRWDYNDRGQLFPQPLFQMNPDGTAQTEFYGNNSWFPTTIMHARGIPGSQKLIAIISGHHTLQKGKLGIIDVSRGRQENEGIQLIAPVRQTEAVRIDAYGQEGDQFQYPYPINEREYIVGFQPEFVPRRHFGLFWMDIDGHRELLMYDPRISCSQPVLVKERPVPHMRPNLVNYSKDYGTYYVQDVYEGPGLKGITEGTCKKLRVIALEYRTAGIGWNGSAGPAGTSDCSTPPSIDNGSWDVKKVLGTATIYEDGSAMFAVPDRTPVYFQVLDEKNHVIQSMRSWSTLQPGEYFSCVGCHESKNMAPAADGKSTLAMAAGPQKLEPFYGPARGFSFPQEIQPILDKHCINCHDQRSGARDDWPDGKAFSLLGTENVNEQAKRKWSDSYLALTQNGQPNKVVNWLGAQSVPTMLEPYTAGAARSRLITLLEEGHEDVKLNAEEMDKIACWIDLLVPYCGDYREANAWNEEEIRFYDHFVQKRNTLQLQENENIRQFMQQRQ